MSQVQKKSLIIPQGETYRLLLTLVDEDGTALNLTGYTARCQFRSTVTSSTSLYTASTDDDITLGGTAGTVLLKIPDSTTEAWEFTSAVYDIEIIDATSNVKRVLQGSVIVDPEVTR